jgi:hypothetical protein
MGARNDARMRIVSLNTVLLVVLVACASAPRVSVVPMPTPVLVPVLVPVPHGERSASAEPSERHVVVAVAAYSTPGPCPPSGFTFVPLPSQERAPGAVFAHGAAACALMCAPVAGTHYFVADVVISDRIFESAWDTRPCMATNFGCGALDDNEDRGPGQITRVVHLVPARDAADAIRRVYEIVNADALPADAVTVEP